MTGSAGGEPLGPRHHEVRRLRALLRDPGARAQEHALVLEGPRLVEDAIRRGVDLAALYVAPEPGARDAAVVSRVRAAGTPVVHLRPGVLERVATTRTPQGVLALAPAPPETSLTTLGAPPGPVVVAVAVADPGNLGTVLRSAEAAGAAGVVVCGGVDRLHPRVVRASAGAIFGVPVVGVSDVVPALAALTATGRRALGAVSHGGVPHVAADLAAPVTLVVGSEAHGLPPEALDALDGRVTIPMAGALESLNVAVTASVLLFEAARQRSS